MMVDFRPFDFQHRLLFFPPRLFHQVEELLSLGGGCPSLAILDFVFPVCEFLVEIDEHCFELGDVQGEQLETVGGGGLLGELGAAGVGRLVLEIFLHRNIMYVS